MENRCFCNVCVGQSSEPMINWESLIRGPISRSKFVVTILSCSIILVPPGAVYYGLGYISPYLYSYLVSTSPKSSVNMKDLVWLNMALVFGQIAGIIVGGILERKSSTKTIARASVCVFNLNIFLMYFSCQNIYSLVTSYLIAGFSLGIIYVMTLVVGLSWIEKHRHGLYSGLLSVGFGISILLIGPLEVLYLNPNELEPRKDPMDLKADPLYAYPAILNKVPKMFILFGIMSSMIQFPLSYLLVKNPELGNEQLDQDTIQDMVKRPRFYLLYIIFGLNFVPIAYIGYYVKTFLEALTQRTWTLELIIALSGIFDAVGRPTFGYIHDRFGIKIAMSLLCFMTSIFVFLSYFSKFINNTAGSLFLFTLSMWSASFCCSGNYGIMPAATIQFFGEEDLGLKYGILYLSQGFGVILMILYDTFIPQWMPFVMTIVFTSLVAGLLALVLRRNETLNDQARALLESTSHDSLVPINEFRLSRRGNNYEYKSVN